MAGFANDAKRCWSFWAAKKTLRHLPPVLPEEAQVIILNRDIWFRMKKYRKPGA